MKILNILCLLCDFSSGPEYVLDATPTVCYATNSKFMGGKMVVSIVLGTNCLHVFYLKHIYHC